MRKQIVGVLGAASIAAAAFIADAPAGTALSAAPAAPAASAASAGHVSATASKRGGKVSRGEIISRAKYWFNVGNKRCGKARNYCIIYNGYRTYRDPDNAKHQYRRDCSGYVDMVLHLASGPNTVSLPSYGHKLKSRKDMKMGDFTGILGRGTAGSAGHVRIFEKWKNKRAGTYYAYDFGSTPVKHKWYTLSKDTSRKGTDKKWHGWTAYTPKNLT